MAADALEEVHHLHAGELLDSAALNREEKVGVDVVGVRLPGTSHEIQNLPLLIFELRLHLRELLDLRLKVTALVTVETSQIERVSHLRVAVTPCVDWVVASHVVLNLAHQGLAVHPLLQTETVHNQLLRTAEGTSLGDLGLRLHHSVDLTDGAFDSLTVAGAGLARMALEKILG